jgi:hypothetical protein
VDAGAAVVVGDVEEERTPVHLEPMGQQAMFLASSSAQTEVEAQQAAP